jgi:replicative superfamily II helicase
MSDEALTEALAALVPAVPVAGGDISGGAPTVADHRERSGVRDAFSDFDNQLIADLVANLKPRTEILKRYGLTEADLVARARNPEWSSRFRQMHAVWNSDQNIKERIRTKAAYLLEDSLVPLFRIIAGSGTHAAKLQAIDQLTKISNVAHNPKDEAPAGGGSRITINIGGGKVPITVGHEDENGRTVARIDAPG